MDEQSLPFSFGVEGSSGDANALHIEAHAISSDDTSRTSRRAVVSLIDGKSLILNLELLQECATVQCGSDKTCLPSGGQGACGSAFVNSNTLEEQMN